jgi:adenylate kinase
MRHRQDVYTEQTAPLIEVYADRGLLVEVDGMGSVQDVTSRVFQALEETNGAAAS